MRPASFFFTDNVASSDLGRASVRGGLFSVVARAGNAIIQLASLIVLARLLTPTDFGLVAMVAAITGIAPFLIDLGLSDATVQRPTIRPGEVSALFWLCAGLGLLLTLTMVAAAPLIASLYSEPRLTLIAVISAPTLVLTALSLQHRALMRRAMMFGQVAAITVIAELVSTIVTIAMAAMGWGYWALVAKPLVLALTALVGAFLLCRWMPGVPQFGPQVAEMVRFGIHVTGFTLADFLGRNVDRVGLGYFYGAKVLGIYERALSVYDSSVYFLAGPLHSVATSGLSKLRDDPELFRRRYADAISTLAFFGMPAFAFIVVSGRDIVVLLMGEKWLDAGTLLSIIALCGPAHIIERTQGWLHVAAGRPDRWARWGVASSLAQVVAVACGLPFGALGVAWAYTICIYVLFIPSALYAGQPVGVRLKLLATALSAQFVGTMITIAIAHVVLHSLPGDVGSSIRIIVSFLTCTLSYVLLVVGLLRVTRPLEIATTVMVDVLPKPVANLVAPIGRWLSKRRR